MKELLVYYYRVVYCEDGHFTTPGGEGGEGGHHHGRHCRAVPRDVIEPTDGQREAMDEMFDALQEEEEEEEEGDEDEGKESEDERWNSDGERDSKLACAIRRFYMSLICQSVGSVPFRSPVISFCAMLSRKGLKVPVWSKAGGGAGDYKKGTGNDEADEAARRRRRLGGWKDPGNYTSDLSKLVWAAQLLLFEAACFYKREEEDQIPTLLEKLCRKFMHQRGETTFGYILQWRLYLSAVAKSAVASNQARWSLDGREIDYLGIKLQMEHISQLVVSEYRRARALLHDELLFGAVDLDITPVEAWRVHDDLDAEDYGGSWLSDVRNEESLRGKQDALLRQIEQRADLRQVFVRDDDDDDDDDDGDGKRRKRLCR
ncbi:hypothetical protein ACQKWADRAFT_326670 [Trichoderma austrokoningii]